MHFTQSFNTVFQNGLCPRQAVQLRCCGEVRTILSAKFFEVGDEWVDAISFVQETPFGHFVSPIVSEKTLRAAVRAAAQARFTDEVHNRYGNGNSLVFKLKLRVDLGEGRGVWKNWRHVEGRQDLRADQEVQESNTTQA